jgi:hypothetical protein
MGILPLVYGAIIKMLFRPILLLLPRDNHAAGDSKQGYSFSSDEGSNVSIGPAYGAI